MSRSRLSLLLIGLLLIGILAACTPQAAAPEGEATGADAAGDLVPVTYTYAGRGVPADLQMVEDAMNAIINERIGVDLTLEPIDFAAFNDKMQLRLAAGEECDIIFTAPWTNSYANNVANGALLPLDDLLVRTHARSLGQHAGDDLECCPCQRHHLRRYQPADLPQAMGRPSAGRFTGKV